jgi:hypothetical protein
MFEYTHNPLVRARNVAVYQTIRDDLSQIGLATQGPQADLSLRWEEYADDVRWQMGARAQTWGRAVIAMVREALPDLDLPGWSRANIESLLQWYESMIMTFWYYPHVQL